MFVCLLSGYLLAVVPIKGGLVMGWVVTRNMWGVRMLVDSLWVLVFTTK